MNPNSFRSPAPSCLKHGLLFLIALVTTTMPCMGQDVLDKTDFVLGETLKLRSTVLEEERVLNVYLPAGYDEKKDRSYPVIYLLDGSADEDFIHVAGLVQFGSFSWIRMIPESIVVGIANVDRKRDFTSPSKNEKDHEELPTSGGSTRFIEALAKEIRPLIGKLYRTQGPSTLIGQSLGGLLATEILYTRTDLFDNYIIVSPSLWWNDRSLLKKDPPTLPKDTAVFIAVGKEGEIMEQVAKELHGKLNAGNPEGARLWFKHLPRLDHGDTLHLAVYEAFEAMFRTPSVP